MDESTVLTIFADGADDTHAVFQVIAAHAGAAVPLPRSCAGVAGRITPAGTIIVTALNVNAFSDVTFSSEILTFDRTSGHLRCLLFVLPSNIPHCSWRRSATPQSNIPERTHYMLPCQFLSTGNTIMFPKSQAAKNLEYTLECTHRDILPERVSSENAWKPLTRVYWLQKHK